MLRETKVRVVYLFVSHKYSAISICPLTGEASMVLVAENTVPPTKPVTSEKPKERRPPSIKCVMATNFPIEAVSTKVSRKASSTSVKVLQLILDNISRPPLLWPLQWRSVQVNCCSIVDLVDQCDVPRFTALLEEVFELEDVHCMNADESAPVLSLELLQKLFREIESVRRSPLSSLNRVDSGQLNRLLSLLDPIVLEGARNKYEVQPPHQTIVYFM